MVVAVLVVAAVDIVSAAVEVVSISVVVVGAVVMIQQKRNQLKQMKYMQTLSVIDPPPPKKNNVMP